MNRRLITILILFACLALTGCITGAVAKLSYDSAINSQLDMIQTIDAKVTEWEGRLLPQEKFLPRNLQVIQERSRLSREVERVVAENPRPSFQDSLFLRMEGYETLSTKLGQLQIAYGRLEEVVDPETAERRRETRREMDAREAAYVCEQKCAPTYRMCLRSCGYGEGAKSLQSHMCKSRDCDPMYRSCQQSC